MKQEKTTRRIRRANYGNTFSNTSVLTLEKTSTQAIFAMYRLRRKHFIIKIQAFQATQLIDQANNADTLHAMLFAALLVSSVRVSRGNKVVYTLQQLSVLLCVFLWGNGLFESCRMQFLFFLSGFFFNDSNTIFFKNAVLVCAS